MILTAQELADLTDRKSRKGQIQWLLENGWPFTLSALGRPKVLRSVAEDKMGGKAPVKREPNWAAIESITATSPRT